MPAHKLLSILLRTRTFHSMTGFLKHKSSKATAFAFVYNSEQRIIVTDPHRSSATLRFAPSRHDEPVHHTDT